MGKILSMLWKRKKSYLSRSLYLEISQSNFDCIIISCVLSDFLDNTKCELLDSFKSL